jgi:hypothetical protein
VTEAVAASFTEFLPMLYRSRNRVTTEAVETFGR